MQFIRSFLMLLVFLTISGLSYAQAKKEDLQKQREDLNEKIALTKKLIRESETKQKLTSNQLAVLQEQIRLREALIVNISQEIKSIDGAIRSKETTITQLEEELEAMKVEYARMITSAYQNRSGYDKLMYVFASENFNQAYKRFKMTQHYAEKRKGQMAAMKSTQAEIAGTILTLQTDKKEKELWASSKEKEKASISQDRKLQENKLTGLRSEEQKLRDEQKKQEADRKKLTAKIEEIIRSEIEAAERKRTEENKTKGTTKTAESTKFDLAPEVKLMNADFEKNKGVLPWPVASGVITSRFGRQPHTSIAGIEIDNKGIDFTTEKNGVVNAVFSGQVTSAFAIPGAGQNIIITHGSYKTVYSGLNEINIKVGDTVTLHQKIGRVLFNGEESILHFEVWKVSAESGAAQNPELWLKRR